MPNLSIIIVHYFSPEVLKDCLYSIYESIDAPPFEVIIVNNGSDKALQEVFSGFTEVIWMDMGYNAGFARANNAGIKKANGDIILLLNSDTILQKDTLACSYQWLLHHDGYAACGARLLYPDGLPQISGNYAMKGGLNYWLMIPYLGNGLKWMARLSGVKPTNTSGNDNAVTDVDWVNGAFLMVKKNAMDKAGLLDEDFFLYHEESEWCHRLKKTGKLAVLGMCSLMHLEGYTSNKSFGSQTKGHNQLEDKKGRQLFLSLMVRMRKEFGLGWLLLHMLVFTFSIIPVWILGFFRTIFIGNWIEYYKKSAGFTKNVLYPWRSMYYLFTNSPHFYKAL
jgi:GT2 family glycosyltransferase